jgi:hypothetical protein
MSRLAHSEDIFIKFGNEYANAKFLLSMKIDKLMINYNPQCHAITSMSPYWRAIKKIFTDISTDVFMMTIGTR